MKLSTIEFQEIQKCRRDPAYFINTYCNILHRKFGRVPFHLFDYQRICIQKFLKHIFKIILKPRQMGLSWLVAGYALWMCLFHVDKKVLMISIIDDVAKALLGKVRFIYENLPEFLKIELETDTAKKMIWATGSEVESVTSTPHAGRSEAVSLLIIDEAAHVEYLEQIWMSAYPTLSTGGEAIVLSTPNGMGNYYYNLWTKAIEGTSRFVPIKLHYYYYPGRDMKWLEEQRANMSSLQIAQEFLCDFITTGNLVFDVKKLRALQTICEMIRPLEILYDDEIDAKEACGLQIFQKPNPRSSYIMPIDPAKGGAGDYHAAHVIDEYTGVQVAEYRTRVPLNVFNDRAFELGMLYNTAKVAPESNFGTGTIMHFVNNGYPNIYEYRDPITGNPKDYGFPTNTLTRPLVIDELETCIREETTGIKGVRTVNELLSFAWNKKGKAEAIGGKHDDLVMAYGIGRFIRDNTPKDYCLPFSVG